MDALAADVVGRDAAPSRPCSPDASASAASTTCGAALGRPSPAARSRPRTAATYDAAPPRPHGSGDAAARDDAGQPAGSAHALARQRPAARGDPHPRARRGGCDRRLRRGGPGVARRGDRGRRARRRVARPHGGDRPGDRLPGSAPAAGDGAAAPLRLERQAACLPRPGDVDGLPRPRLRRRRRAARARRRRPPGVGAGGGGPRQRRPAPGDGELGRAPADPDDQHADPRLSPRAADAAAAPTARSPPPAAS